MDIQEEVKQFIEAKLSDEEKAYLKPINGTCNKSFALGAFRGYKAGQEASVAIIQNWLDAYPEDIFIEPPTGEHGKTVDACSARAARHVLKGMLKEMEIGRMLAESVFVQVKCPKCGEVYHTRRGQ